MNNQKKLLFLIAGVSGFILGTLYSPDKGSVNRLKAKKLTNKLSNQALEQVEKWQSSLNEIE